MSRPTSQGAPRRGPRGQATLSLLVPRDPEAPRTRADCRNVQRPCPFVACAAHLKYDVDPDSGALIDNFPGHDWDEMEQTCSLDVADQGPQTFETIGRLMGVNMQSAQGREHDAVDELEAKLEPLGVSGTEEVRGVLCVVSVQGRAGQDGR